jgi:hypothetical protein
MLENSRKNEKTGEKRRKWAVWLDGGDSLKTAFSAGKLARD